MNTKQWNKLPFWFLIRKQFWQIFHFSKTLSTLLDQLHLSREWLCKVVYVALSDWNSARMCDITRGQLSIDFVHRFSTAFFFCLNQKYRSTGSYFIISKQCFIRVSHGTCHLNKSIVMWRGKMHFHEQVEFCKNLCTVPWDNCTVVISQKLEECHLRGQHFSLINEYIWNIISLDWIILIFPNFWC